MLEQFEEAWRSQTDKREDTLQQEIEKLLGAIQHERRRDRIVLMICSAYTMASIVGVAYVWTHHDAPLLEVLPLVIAQGIAITALLYFLRRSKLRPRPSGAAIRENISNALAQTQSEISSLKVRSIAMIGLTLCLAVSVGALSDSGKMDGQSLRSFALVLLLILIGNGAFIWSKWSRVLQPRRERLRKLISDLK